LASYSRRPFGVFHALPLARGSSLLNSGPLVADFQAFYGQNIFNAETSATTGLDSLLEPKSVISEAQQLAAQCYGSLNSFWVTNGTSTANKITAQAILSPGDIVLIDGNCHKSHLYSMILVGAFPIFLDSYPLPQYAAYGGVPLQHIKRSLLTLRNEGKLHRVKMLLLTNITFDGLAYNCIRIMEECLAIKPDLVFLWDEAWWAFARYHPLTRLRTAMYAAQVLATRYASLEYAELYKNWKGDDADLLAISDMETLVASRLLPDPARVRVRVYSTQSTHKTLTAFRQGSMIHIYDQDFQRLVRRAFDEAYFTHTSTSPNYQILASLDVGRRQVALAGYKLVNRQLHEAIQLRAMLTNNPLINKYFEPCSADQLIPIEFRPSHFQSYTPPQGGSIDWASIYESWGENGDEFVLDPCRINIYSARSGLNGTELKHKLSVAHNIQVNKTSINTILCMTTIGTTRSAAAHLVECFTKITQEIEHHLEHASDLEIEQFHNKVEVLTHKLPPLPRNSPFHPRFRMVGFSGEADIRTPFFQSYSECHCEYIPLTSPRLQSEDVVSAALVIPYPPGFALLIPGQIITKEIAAFLQAIDVKEIHGYNPAVGLRVFRQGFISGIPQVPSEISNVRFEKTGSISPEDCMSVTPSSSASSLRSPRSVSLGTLPPSTTVFPSTPQTSNTAISPEGSFVNGFFSTPYSSTIFHGTHSIQSPTSPPAASQFRDFHQLSGGSVPGTPLAHQSASQLAFSPPSGGVTPMQYSSITRSGGLSNPISPVSGTPQVVGGGAGFPLQQGGGLSSVVCSGDVRSPPHQTISENTQLMGILKSSASQQIERPEFLTPQHHPTTERGIFNIDLDLF